MARFSKARWRGPVPNRTPEGMVRPIMGLVLHIEQGNEEGTNAWFHNIQAQASSHFGNPRYFRLHGKIRFGLDQWVDTNDKAWAEAQGNSRWISLENAGRSGQKLTRGQIRRAAKLLAWLHRKEGVPLRISDSPAKRGLGWHGMGGAAWGGHLDCPGEPIKRQRQQIIDRAQRIDAKHRRRAAKQRGK